jgi:WD40 repeat protein/serine/threonine protein kinase
VTAQPDSLRSSRSASDSADRELARVLEVYLADLEAGQAVDAERLVAEHPAIADRLRACLASLHLVERAADAFPPSNHGLSQVTAEKQLGDYRILREVGRGGMGIVYEAEQISLGRRVALKVLPFAATMDARHLRRFQNEARAAASLEHPHIVPVYCVGNERGVHYYAMKFIDGQSLARLIERQRAESSQPLSVAASAAPADGTAPGAAARTERAQRDAAAFRQIAEWGIQAAEALEHAHTIGIVHRDIKPANLMIDPQGQLWVTDFGLARTAADAGLTMTGDVLGTLRYMSPEQALAKHGLVDHRTDVYSLGVTLYELLTGRPAISGKDREEILNRIILENTLPPRSFDATIPRDLETVVLKTMARNPAERYSTAAELAEDLRRYVRDEPIRARRPGPMQRLAKWARRHRRVIGSLALGLVIAVIALGASVALTTAAYRAEIVQRREADHQKGLALAANAQAEQERDFAEHRLYLARTHQAHKSLQENDLQRTEELLEQNVPKPGRPDFRGWEWSYLKALCHRELCSFGDDQYLISTMAWSSNGKHLLTTGRMPNRAGQLAKAWDPMGSGEVFSIRESGDAPMAWSPDARFLAVGGQIRDPATGTLITTLPEANGLGVWSPDGQRVAYVGANSGRVWDVATGNKLLVLPAVGRLAVWSPKGRYLAIASPDVVVWDVAAGKQVLAARFSSLRDLAWSPDESYLAFSDGTNLHVYDLPAARPRLTQPHYVANMAHPLCWSPDGERIAVADTYARSEPKARIIPSTVNASAVIRVWNIRTGKESAALFGHQKAVSALAWCPDALRLVSASYDGSVRVWNATAGNEILTHRHGSPQPLRVCWNPDGKRIALHTAGMVRIWDGATDPDAIVLHGSTYFLESLAWRPDSRRLVSAGINPGVDCQIRFWDPVTGENVRSVAEHVSMGTRSAVLSWSPDGNWLAHTGVGTLKPGGVPKEAVVVRSAATGKVERILGGYSRALAWGQHSDCLSLLVDGGPQTSLAFYDLARGCEVAGWKGLDGPSTAESIARSPDDRRLAIASDPEGLIKVWNVATGQRLLTIRVNMYNETGVAWSPDGRLLAAADHQSTVWVWDAATGAEVAALRGHHALPIHVAWTPDGRRLLSADGTGILRLWDVTAGQEALVLRAAEGDCQVAVWSPDGRYLATGHLFGTIRIWDAAPRRGLMSNQRLLAERRLPSGEAPREDGIPGPEIGRPDVALPGGKRTSSLADSCVFRF